MNIFVFKARNAKHPRCWIYGYFVIEDGTCLIVNTDGKFPVIAGTERLYTCKKDRDNRKIFEEDFVRIEEDRIAKVKWSDKTGAFMLDGHIMGASWCREGLERLGDEFENPELVKK